MIKELIYTIVYFSLKGILLSYPIVSTAITIKRPRNIELLHWMIFWSLLGLINLSESLLSFIPFYYLLELTLIFILQNELATRFIKRYILVMLVKDFRWLYTNKIVDHYVYQFLVKYKIIGFLETYYKFISDFNKNPSVIIGRQFNYQQKTE